MDARLLVQLGHLLGQQVDPESLISAVIQLFTEQAGLHTAFLVRDPETGQLSGQAAPGFVESDHWIRVAPRLLAHTPNLRGPTPMAELPIALQETIMAATSGRSASGFLVPICHGNTPLNPLGLLFVTSTTGLRHRRQALD